MIKSTVDSKSNVKTVLHTLTLFVRRLSGSLGAMWLVMGFEQLVQSSSVLRVETMDFDKLFKRKMTVFNFIGRSFIVPSLVRLGTLLE